MIRTSLRSIGIMMMTFLMMGAPVNNAEAQMMPKRRLSSLGFFESDLPPLPVFTRWELMTAFSSGTYESTDQTAHLNAIASLARLVNKQIQVGGEGGLVVTTNKGNNSTTVKFALFGTYNFSPRISNAYFARLGWGFASNSSTAVSSSDAGGTNDGFFIGAGRRVELWGHVSYSPEVRFQFLKDNKTQLQAKVLNFSILF